MVYCKCGNMILGFFCAESSDGVVNIPTSSLPSLPNKASSTPTPNNLRYSVCSTNISQALLIHPNHQPPEATQKVVDQDHLQPIDSSCKPKWTLLEDGSQFCEERDSTKYQVANVNQKITNQSCQGCGRLYLSLWSRFF